MNAGVGTLHLGLDLGATNLKWAVVAHAAEEWRTVAQGQVPTRLVADPAAVPGHRRGPARRGRGGGRQRAGPRRERRDRRSRPL